MYQKDATRRMLVKKKVYGKYKFRRRRRQKVVLKG
jgi:hypothetical protein